MFNGFLFFVQLLANEFSEKLFLLLFTNPNFVRLNSIRYTASAIPICFSLTNLQIKAFFMDHQKTLCSYNLLMVISYKKLFVMSHFTLVKLLWWCRKRQVHAQYHVTFFFVNECLAYWNVSDPFAVIPDTEHDASFLKNLRTS